MDRDSYSNCPPPGRILVVDDNEDLLRTISSALGKWLSVSLETCSDPLQARSLLPEHPFDLFLLDIRMPDLDGVSLLSECRRLQPGVPVILMTAYASVEEAVNMMRLGADYYLAKPFSPATLREVVLKVLGSSERAGANIAPEAGEFQTTDLVTREVLRRAQAAAETDASVLIQGESGTGKELMARFIHRRSRRAAGPFEVVNSAAMPESLVEAILFGYERGAFTGALKAMPGKVEAASGGTLFLDEVGDMSLACQAKVLRVLQDKTFQRLGDTKGRTSDVRYVFATNRDLVQLMMERGFREDLYYRVAVVELKIPPLRQRPGDVVMLAELFLARYAESQGRRPAALSAETADFLKRLPWPGNVRQLQNFCQRAAIFHPEGRPLTPAAAAALLGGNAGPGTRPGESPGDERTRLLAALREADGNITRAASLLGVSRPTIYAWMKRHHLSPAEDKNPSPD